jgi:signal transduction histidine kinase
MRRLGLSTLLIAANVGIVLAALAAGFAGSIALFRSLADQQAFARALQAGRAASRALDQSGEEALVDARLLAARPTLATLLAARDGAALTAYLDRFRETSGLDACVVTHRGAIVGRSGLDLPAAILLPLAAEAASPLPPPESRAPAGSGPPRPAARWGRQIAASGHGGPLLLLARAPIPSEPGWEVLTARSVEDALVREIGRAAGASILVLDASRAASEAEAGDRADLRAAALATESAQTGRVREDGSFVCAMPLRAFDGALAGILEVALPASDLLAPPGRLVGRLLVLAAALALIAALVSYLLASRLVGPLHSLAEASQRIGRGELGTPIPRAGVAEVGRLAATMEEMQGRLLRLIEVERERQAEAEAVLTGIVEGVFVVDRERRIRYMNPQAARLLGVDPGAAVGRFCGDVLRPEGASGTRPCEVSCPILDARFGRSARASEQLALPDGRRRTVVVTSAAPARSGVSVGGGAESRQFQVMRDETELEATRRLRDTVLANISHEFRTPLSAQIASIELLLDRLPDLSRAEVRRLLVSLERGANRLTHLIDNLLESVRIDSGRDSIRRQPVALDEVIEAAVAMTGYLMEQRGQRIEVALPHPVPIVSGDAPRLTQVFVNLLANASKFSPEGSAVRIGGRTEADAVALWVEDEGPGLPKGESPAALFGRFVRSPGEEPAESGLGLGLSIVKSIVERHGGHVAAGDGPGGIGTRIDLWLPLEPPSREDPQHKGSPRGASRYAAESRDTSRADRSRYTSSSRHTAALAPSREDSSPEIPRQGGTTHPAASRDDTLRSGASNDAAAADGPRPGGGGRGGASPRAGRAS